MKLPNTLSIVRLSIFLFVIVSISYAETVK